MGAARLACELAETRSMKGAKQTTLRDQIAISGVGVHSGLPVTLTLNPAHDDEGIVFRRVSADGSIEREIRADVRAVTATEFATVLGDTSGPLCSTAEHLLAALRGLYVDNVFIEIDGPEVPIMDGSAAAFVDAIDQAGLTGMHADAGNGNLVTQRGLLSALHRPRFRQLASEPRGPHP